MNDRINTLRIQLDGLKTNVCQMFVNHNDDLNKYIVKTINETITEDWVKSEVKKAVNENIRNAIKDTSRDYHIQQAIKSTIVEHIVGLLESNKNEEVSK
jgi:methionine salvage enolase-phosphatase E1